MWSGLSLWKDYSNVTPIKYKSTVPSRSYRDQNGLCGTFFAPGCSRLSLIYFHFPALRLVLLFPGQSQFQMLLTVLPGRPPDAFLPGPYEWGGVGASGTPLGEGKMKESSSLLCGPSFFLRAGLSPSIMRFVF